MSDGVGVGRHVAPGEDLAALASDGSFDLVLLVYSAEDHRHAKRIAILCELCVLCGKDLPEKRMGNPHE